MDFRIPIQKRKSADVFTSTLVIYDHYYSAYFIAALIIAGSFLHFYHIFALYKSACHGTKNDPNEIVEVVNI